MTYVVMVIQLQEYDGKSGSLGSQTYNQTTAGWEFRCNVHSIRVTACFVRSLFKWFGAVLAFLGELGYTQMPSE